MNIAQSQPHSPEDRPTAADAYSRKRARTAAPPSQACLFSIHSSDGWGRDGPKFQQDPTLQMYVKPGATFSQLDQFLREALHRDGHLSTFRIKTGEVDGDFGGYQHEEEIEVEGDFGGAYLDDFQKANSTKVKSLVWAAKPSRAVWHFDLGNTTHVSVKALQLASVEETMALNDPIQDCEAGTESESEEDEDADNNEGTFDDAFPSIANAIINEGGLDIGKGACNGHFWATVWNEGGGLVDMDEPCGGAHPLDSSLRSLEMDVAREENEDEEPHTATFSFEARYPKVAKFISTTSQKRWVEIGTGRMGPVVKALASGKVVWKSSLRQQFGNSPHAALCALEKHLPE